jgi:hypothetical protein
MFHIDADLAFWKVANVTVGRFHGKTLSEKLAYGFRLGRRFDND